jgi:hypothetical protein
MATTLQLQPASDELRLLQHGVARRLERVRRRMRTHLLVEGLFWTLTAVAIAAAASLLADWIWRFNLPTRQVLLAAAVVAIGLLVVRRLIQPLALPLGDLDLAELLDRRVPGVGQQICNVLQLPVLLESKHFASPAMVEAAVAECAQSLDRVDLLATLNTPRRSKLLAGCAAWLLLVVGFCALWPATSALWARRWLAGSDIRWPQHTYLSIVGLGDAPKLLVPRGELSLVQISARPRAAKVADGWELSGRGRPLLVESADPPQSRPPAQVNVVYRLADGTKKRAGAVQFDESTFRYELPPLADPVAFSVTGGDDWLDPITIEPIDRPAIRSLEIAAVRPGSSQREVEQVGAGTSQYLYLRETQLELRLVADQPLESAELFDKGARVKGWQRQDERSYTLSWTMQEPLALEFRLTSRQGGLASKPYFLAIGLLKDREPRLTIRSSGVGRRVTPVARIRLAIRATDDFGLATLTLELERTIVRDEKPEVKEDRLDLSGEPPPKDAPPRTDLGLDYELALRDRELAPGNLVKLRSAATDNCALGVQSGYSRWLSFQIVSADELFYEVLTRQREQRARFNKAVDSAKEQSAALAGLTTRDEAIAVARAESVISRQVWQIANQLEASLVEMTLNDLGNPAARDIMQSGIITPMRTLHADLLTRLRESVDKLVVGESVAEAQRAEAVTISQQAVEAMQAILAQMAQWESFVDVINQLKHVIQRQDELLKATEQLQKKRTDALFDD